MLSNRVMGNKTFRKKHMKYIEGSKKSLVIIHPYSAGFFNIANHQMFLSILLSISSPLWSQHLLDEVLPHSEIIHSILLGRGV